MPSRWGEFVTPTRPTTRGFGHVDARSRWLCAARLDNVTPNTGRPCVATVLGGVSRPSNVRASDLIKSQWAPCFMHRTVRAGTTLQCPPLVVVEPKGCDRDPVLLVPGVPSVSDRHDSTTSVHRCSIVLSDAEYLVSVGSRPCSLVACAFCPSTTERCSRLVMASPLPSYSLFDGICYSDNRSNSRANTCNKPRLLEGMHLLDKRSTRALPVALMIHDNSTDRTALVPATHHSNFCPINFRWGGVGRSRLTVSTGLLVPTAGDALLALIGRGRSSGAVTLKKLECSKQAYACIH
ncbi:hypothetical protein V6N13_056723 [Hibiscus sabdariffa]